MDAASGRYGVRSWGRFSLAFGLGLLVVSVYLGIFPSFAAAQTITVNTLTDKANPPFNADSVCGVGTIANLPVTISLREAIIAANNTPGAQTITFAPGLSGGTININFDNLDAGVIPNPLPLICDSDTTINGDLNGDNVPDITLNGAALAAGADGLVIISNRNTVKSLWLKNFPDVGIAIFHAMGIISTDSKITKNAILDNIVQGGNFPILVQAGSIPGFPGGVTDTSVRRNLISGAAFDGIIVFTGDAEDSFLDSVAVTGNTIQDNGRFGIHLFANFSSAGGHTNITHVNIAENTVTGNGSVGILINPFQGDYNVFGDIIVANNELSDNVLGVLVEGGDTGANENSVGVIIKNNMISGNGGGIAVVGGVFSSSDNYVTTTVKKNSVTDNTGSGIVVIAGEENSSGNSVKAHITKNTVKMNDGSGIVAWGGLGAFLNSNTGTSNDNILEAQIRKNVVKTHTFSGISVVGGVGSLDGRAGAIANNNQVTAKVKKNKVDDADHYGIGLAAGGPGLASLNQLTAEVIKNKACNSGITDIQVYGGSLAFASFPANAGTGNVAQADVKKNTATTIGAANGVAGNSAVVTQLNNVPCP